MRRSSTLIVVLGLVVASGCSKDEKKSESAAKATDPSSVVAEPKGDTKPEPASSGAPVADVGVEAGGLQRDASEGPAAVLTAVTGTVEVRRVGETEFAPAKADQSLFAGDSIRTGEASTATFALADESVVEVAEVSMVAVTSRHASADPASGAAVLAGLARFTVTPRAPGEGAFRVYTPAGVILTKGTVYGVGVGASGQARVGVESGLVDVIGLATIDAAPIEVAAGSSVSLDATGSAGSPAPWPQDDWGLWRDDVDAKLELDAAVGAHGTAMADLDSSIRAAYADLDASADSVASFEASAAASADKGDTASYEASLPEGAATIDASFSVASRLDALTWAYAGHATLAHDIYVRHPAEVEAQWAVVAPRVDVAVLWPKRYEVTAVGYLEPLRTQYYVHHPRGRLHAELVGVAVPEFYATVDVPQIEPARVRGRVKTKIWIAPDVRYTASARPVWVAAPSVDWRVKAKLSPAPFRAKVGWYVRPPTLKAKVLVGGDLTGRYVTKVKVKAPEPRASLRAHWKVPVGLKVRVAPPDLNLAARARANVKIGVGGRLDANVRDHRAVVMPAGGADVRGKVNVRVPDVKAKASVKVRVPDVKAGIGVKVRDHRDAAVGIGGGVKGRVDGGAKAAAGVKVKVQAPAVKVKIKAPSIKVKGEAKGGFRLGN